MRTGGIENSYRSLLTRFRLFHEIRSGRIAHAYLFEGIEGCGKRLTALALVEALFCGRCGTQVGRRCPACDAVVAPDLSFCTSCGATLEPAPALPAEERKTVSVLFVDLVGFTEQAERLDPEEVRALLAPYHERARAELERFGGTVEKFIGDAVVALFGAPIAHEDDPERAVRAGLAVRDAFAELEAGVRVGITTGEALVKRDAKPLEGEAMAAGDVVNTAARLQAAAPVNGILVDEATHRATEHAIEYAAREPVSAKGKTEPVPVWEALAPRARLGVDIAFRGAAPLVGRDDELDALRDALGRARRDRTAQLVTLVGPPGMGKSRLVYELWSSVETDPELPYWRQGRSLPYGHRASFWALGEMTKAQAGILESDDAEAAERKLSQAVAHAVPDREAGWIAGDLRPLVGLAGESAGADKQDEVFAAWRRFFEALAEQRPLVLVFEDLHWADDGLLDFVDELTERSRRDPKTKLMNFDWFMERLESFLAVEQRVRWCGVGVVDITSFKWYNDTFGHATGDKIIEGVARILSDQIRSEDFLALERGGEGRDLHARFGGDEFCFLIPDLDEYSQAYAIGERFREAVERHDWTLEDRRLAVQPVRVDVGVVCLWLGRVADRTSEPVHEQHVRASGVE